MSASLPEMNAHWLPFTNNRDFKSEPRMLVRARGLHYWDQQGRQLLDGSSGLFVAAAGHCRPEISRAVHDQLNTLDYAPSFQRTHPAALQAATAIADITPPGMEHIFFCNSGSESVDTAIKIAFAYHIARREGERVMLVSRERAYHGVNMGGTALSGMVRNRESFGPGMPGVLHMRHTWMPSNRFTMGQAEVGRELADDLLRMVNTFGAKRIAAVFVEPIAGSTGVLVPPLGYLERLRELCDQFGILLVFDEVICGFGRTGKAFAAQSFGVTPDIITMAKAITNGAQPMGAVAVSDKVHDTILDAADRDSVEFFHGYTFSAHPAACAAALATAKIYQQEGLFERGEKLAPHFLQRVEQLGSLDAVTDVRGYGLLAGVDIRPAGKPGHAGDRFQKRLFDAGMHVKTTGDAMILAPALICTPDDVDRMIAMVEEVLREF